jgi:ATP-binding cassette subfamily F protein 3
LYFEGKTLIDEVRSVFADLISIESELQDLEIRLAQTSACDPDYPAILARYGSLQEHFRQGNGFRIDSDIGQILCGLGFTTDDWLKPCEHFSGGWQMRIALAKLLLRRPSMLLLDEPTNHLDLQARDWMKEYLEDYPSAIVLVSHDRHFLDVVVKRCTELYNGQLTDYHGNFSYYEIERERRYAALEEAQRRQHEEIEKIERFIERFRYKASKASQVQSRVKQLEKIERVELPPPPPQVRFKFPEPPRSGRIVMELQGICKSYGDNHVLQSINWQIERGERIALIGVNGAGKSTLLRILAGTESYTGERILGYQVDIGFFAQDQRQILDPNHTVLQSLESISPYDMVPRLRTMLGSFLFRGDDVDKKVSILSGGERSRLAIAHILLQPHNLLLLDEPTNHLDINAQRVLLDALRSFSGTIIFVSHDRYFIEKLATSVVEVSQRHIEKYIGGYGDFLHTKQMLGLQHQADHGIQWTTAHREQTTPRDKHIPTTSPTSTVSLTSAKLSSPTNDNIPNAQELRRKRYDEQQRVQREFSRRKRIIEKQIENLEISLEAQESHIAKLEIEMSKQGFYDNYESASAIAEDYRASKSQIETDYAQWELLQEELQSLLEEEAQQQKISEE